MTIWQEYDFGQSRFPDLSGKGLIDLCLLLLEPLATPHIVLNLQSLHLRYCQVKATSQSLCSVHHLALCLGSL